MSATPYGPNHVIPGTVYRVVRHLATGGMGTVYDVEDTTVGKRYVLKALHPRLVQRDDLVRRMAAEARVLARLSHPNIVEVVTAGATADALALPYFVMERLNGQTLRTILEKKGALEQAHAVRIAADVLDALQHAHDAQIIHRDVKPENIFLHRSLQGVTTTKLLDFGIMRVLDGSGADTQGRFVGTLRYAAPEQIRGESLSPATDVYAAGLVLYEMLAGRGPFDDRLDGESIGAAHLRVEPPHISAFADVGADVGEVLMASLAKEPAARPRDAATMAARLREVLAERASSRGLRALEVSVASSRGASALVGAERTARLARIDGGDGTVPVDDARPFLATLDARGGSPLPPLTVAEGAARRRSSPPDVDRDAETRAARVLATERLPTRGTERLLDAPGGPSSPLEPASRRAFAERGATLPVAPYPSFPGDLPQAVPPPGVATGGSFAPGAYSSPVPGRARVSRSWLLAGSATLVVVAALSGLAVRHVLVSSPAAGDEARGADDEASRRDGPGAAAAAEATAGAAAPPTDRSDGGARGEPRAGASSSPLPLSSPSTSARSAGPRAPRAAAAAPRADGTLAPARPAASDAPRRLPGLDF